MKVFYGKKGIKVILLAITFFLCSSYVAVPEAQAQTMQTYTVRSGDSMWKIAVRFQVGITEIIEANPQIKNPNLIYPGEKLNIPNYDRIKSIEHQVIQLCNQQRAKYGLPALTPVWQLSRVARHKATDMRDRGYFSHQSPTYGSPFDMMRAYGISFSSAGENIAMGQSTPQEVVQAWMNSPGHRQNILSRSFTTIGVGYAEGGSGRYYWSEMFISR